MKTLKLSTDLSFPIDAITQTFLIVGKRGSGKSNTAARLCKARLRPRHQSRAVPKAKLTHP